MRPRSWSEWLGLLVLLGVVAICAFFAGVASKTYDLNDLRQANNGLQKENQAMRETVQRERDQRKISEDKRALTENQLKDAFNAYRTIALNINDTTSVATGHFTVGLAGPPANEKISINLNGAQHTVAAGDSIDVGASTCRVEVKSFDKFTVTLLTSCTPIKP